MAQLDNRQRLGLLIAIFWTILVFTATFYFQHLYLVGFMGLLAVILFPLRRR